MRRRKSRSKNHFSILIKLMIIVFICSGLTVFSVLAFGKPTEYEELTSSSSTKTTAENKTTPWNLTLVNRENFVPKDYDVTLITILNSHQIDERIYKDLQAMFDTARQDGVDLMVASGYRTQKKQETLFKNKINEYINMGYSQKEAREKAETWVAVPGTSEHQLGIAVDIHSSKFTDYENERVYSWLEENAYKFGFIYRYPQSKIHITGIMNEPWHYRYVGVEAATEMKNRGICLEEYLDNLS